MMSVSVELILIFITVRKIKIDCCSYGKWNYKYVLDKYPKIRKFIEVLVNKLNHVNSARLKLEEKTLNIFYNDLKNMDHLVNIINIG
jgi:hypothetical protein